MKRLSLLAVLQARFPRKSKDELYASILCGEVYSSSERLTDPKALVQSDIAVEIRRSRFVSRAGEKLAAALRQWDVPTKGRIWIDAGASTGGFTDCLLQHGAAAVHAVDVGYNQLDYALRVDSRVLVHERTNIRAVQSLQPAPQAAVCDLSFRSLRGVISHLLTLTEEGWGIALIKPQFEAAAEARWGVASADLTGGVLRSDSERQTLLDRLEKQLSSDGVWICDRSESPLPGRKGNREMLALVTDGRLMRPATWRRDLRSLHQSET